jgi:hypothetical protein
MAKPERKKAREHLTMVRMNGDELAKLDRICEAKGLDHCAAIRSLIHLADQELRKRERRKASNAA